MRWLRSIVLRVRGRLGTKSAPDATSASPTEGKKLQLEFWTAFREFIDDHGSTIKTTKTLSGAWMNISIGRSGFQLMAVATLSNRDSQSKDAHHLRAELYIDNTEAKKFLDS